jgi:peptidyl-prolyl cis-trans isomerase C
LYQEAVKRELYKQEEVKKVIEEARRKILIARLLQENITDQIDLTEAEIEDYYNENPDQFMRPEIMRVSHILVPTRERALEIVDELDKGVPFSELARAQSIDPTAQHGGDIGYFPKGQLMPEFENACAMLAVGAVSGPVKTKLGYHIIKVTDRKQPEIKPLKDVKDLVKRQLLKSTQKEKFDTLISQLTGATEITVNQEVLDGDNNEKEADSEEK